MYRSFRRNTRRTVLYRTTGREGRFNKIKSFDPRVFIETYTQQNTTSDYQKEVIVNTFSDFKISDTLKTNIKEKGYKVPTPIQDKTIPHILEGKDLIGIANTGTGKTAAFLIPLVQKSINQRSQKTLVVTPTRELAIQIDKELFGFTKDLNIRSALCIGGSNINRQIWDLRKNPNFVIGTPGRILDLVKKRKLFLQDFESVVLDETDRMVDIGFIKDIKYIISLLPQNRQSLFFSATVDGKVREIIERFVKNPVTVSVKKTETAENIIQDTVKIDHLGNKINKLHELLIKNEFEKVLIFARTKHGVQRLSNDLNKRGFKSDAIHGNKNQSQRSRTLEKFKKSEIKILIATDVASRGLDIPNVSHVINYDLPESRDTYIHRIGRTGRADKKGVAITFVN